MYLPEVTGRVRRYHPGMRWIVLLRDPVARAVSHYRMERVRGNETLPFEEAIAAERARLRRDHGSRKWNASVRLHSYVDRGLYTRQIRRLWRVFGRERVLILTTHGLRTRHEETLRRVYDFLGVRDRDFIPPAETVFATPDGEEVSAAARGRVRRKFAWEMWKLRWILETELFHDLLGE